MFSDNDDLFRKIEEEEKRKREAALKVMEFFITAFSPATSETADTFYTTAEISQAIAEHTGTTLDKATIYEMLINMGYKFDAKNGLDFNWLLKKE